MGLYIERRCFIVKQKDFQNVLIKLFSLIMQKLLEYMNALLDI